MFHPYPETACFRNIKKKSRSPCVFTGFHNNFSFLHTLVTCIFSLSRYFMQGFRNNKSHGFNQVLIYVSIGKPMTQASCHQSDKWRGVIGSHLG